MKSILCSVISVLICIPSLSDSLPNRQRRLSIHHLSKTNTGAFLIGQIGSSSKLSSIYIFDEIQGDTNLKLHQIVNENSTSMINVNSDLLASSSLYMSWVLAQAISDYRVLQIEEKYSAEKLPLFIETTQWAMSLAMRHWKEMGFPNDHDYANHPDDHIAEVAKRLQASTTELSRFYKASPKSFREKVKARHISLGYPNLSIQEFINSNIDMASKKAAKELKAVIDRELD